MTAKILSIKGLAELGKRVPPNQIKQFEKFHRKTMEYYRRVNSLPDRLSPLDWDFYRRHVRDGFVEIVDQFQVKYEELDNSFAQRYDVLDHSKYYTEWQELEAQVRAEVEKFIEASRDRVRIYEEEIRRLKNLKYDNMTMEQFIEAREEAAHMIPGQKKPLFWPHTTEEQIVLKKVKPVNEKESKEMMENGKEKGSYVREVENEKDVDKTDGPENNKKI